MKKNRLSNIPTIIFLSLGGTLLILAYVFSSHQSTIAATDSTLPKLLGINIDYFTNPNAMTEVQSLDTWSAQVGGAPTSIIGIHSLLETHYLSQLITIWDNGFTPFVFLLTGHTLDNINSGSADADIRSWAQDFINVSQGGTNMAFIALLPEMNVGWLAYAGTPAEFKSAYQHIQDIFTQEGVSPSTVRWVFMPTRTTSGTDFEEYYPSSSTVDVLGLIARNFGHCPGNSWDVWEEPESLLSSYVPRLRALDLSKPMFIQLATTAQYPQQGTYDYAKKSQWVIDAYTYLASSFGVQGVIYTNENLSCDWPVYESDGNKIDGYRQAAAISDFGYVSPTDLAQADLTITFDTHVFLPLVLDNVQTVVPDKPVLGVHISDYVGNQDIVDAELKAMDSWTGKSTSLVGIFMDIEEVNPAYNIDAQFETLRINGYTAFLNLMTERSAAQIANGSYDSAIRNVAQGYYAWASQGNYRRAFVAPLPEMNGDWYSYGHDPTNFKIAYARIRNIFTQEGVTTDMVWWVFAPSRGVGDNGFENYYPGDNLTDIVAFSAYNYGYCEAIAPWYEWQEPATLFGPVIDRMRIMAPTKPIFVAQTGVTSETEHGWDDDAKNQWLEDAYNYLATAPSVRGVLYFNIKQQCDWRFFSSGGIRYEGYKNGVSNENWQYVTPKALAQWDLTIDAVQAPLPSTIAIDEPQNHGP